MINQLPTSVLLVLLTCGLQAMEVDAKLPDFYYPNSPMAGIIFIELDIVVIKTKLTSLK